MPIEALDAALAGLAAAEDPNHDLALDQAAMDLQHDNDEVQSLH